MALPIVAIVGRPNVGKSTLVNRIAQTSDAIVHEKRGVTRDRSYHKADWNGLDMVLVDTGGIEMASDDDFQTSIRDQAFLATEQADAIILLVDGRVGLQVDDEEVARILQRTDKPTLLAVNKLDNPQNDMQMWEFYQLGLGEPWPVSALHGHGTGDMLDELVERLRERLAQDAATADSAADTDAGDLEGASAQVLEDPDGSNDCAPEAQPIINIAIIGRPNAGKSSLTNKLTNDDRSIVSPVAGTTRDAIDTFVEHDGREYRIVDTAGLRRKSKIDDSVEYYSFVRAMRAIDRADVALLVIDGSLGLTNEDQRVANYAAERGCALVIVLNKWDIVKGADAKGEVREKVADQMQFVSYAPVVAISALTGKNVQNVWKAVDESYANFSKTISTSQLNQWLSRIRETGHSVTKGKTILRMKYVTQTATQPPRFTIFCNRPDVVTDNYRRYLENRLRDSFDLSGTPIRLSFKKKD